MWCVPHHTKYCSRIIYVALFHLYLSNNPLLIVIIFYSLLTLDQIKKIVSELVLIQIIQLFWSVYHHDKICTCIILLQMYLIYLWILLVWNHTLQYLNVLGTITNNSVVSWSYFILLFLNYHYIIIINIVCTNICFHCFIYIYVIYWLFHILNIWKW